MEIDLINLITILNLHLFWEEYSKITHNFSNYNNKHFKHFRSLHIYLSNDAAVYSSSLLRNISFAIFPPTKARQFIADASSFSLEPHRYFFFSLPFCTSLVSRSPPFFFSFSLSFPTGFISFFIGTREDARCAGRERNHRIGLCRPRWFSRTRGEMNARGEPVKFAPKILRPRQPRFVALFLSFSLSFYFLERESKRERDGKNGKRRRVKFVLAQYRRKYLRTFFFFFFLTFQWNFFLHFGIILRMWKQCLMKVLFSCFFKCGFVIVWNSCKKKFFLW